MKPLKKKLNCITKAKNEIVFLSDIRLNSTKQTIGTNDLRKRFGFYGYDFYFNSKTSSRGVGILISKKLDYKILDSICDTEDNYMLLDTQINNTKLTLGAVYGPNNDNTTFFDKLLNDTKRLKNDNIIWGGDWNATWDSSDNDINIDTLNMMNLPSKNRSEKLNAIAAELTLMDPYRIFYPTKSEFTYVPSVLNQINRSRLDFF